MSNQVPLRLAEIVQIPALSRKFLHPVFAEHPNPRGIGLANRLRWERLTDAHQRDVSRIAPTPPRSRRHPLAHLSNIFSDGHCRDLTTETANEVRSKK